MESFIRGSCETMCPKPEIEMRTREKLLHFYELRPGSRTEPDPSRMVKEFSRSAAGVRRPKHGEIRSVRALRRTVDYLLADIFEDKRRPYNFKYEFIFDRLRAIRQEVVMQNLNVEETLDILEPTSRFLAYSAYHLCEHPISDFDPKICGTHLQECLKKVLRCYDDLDEQSKNYDVGRRTQMEALYLMFNLGSAEALFRGISLQKNLKQVLKLELALSVEYLRGNFYRVLQNMHKLSPLGAVLASLKLPEIRRQLLLRFSTAFQSKVLTVPLEWIGHVLHFQECEAPALIEDCKHYDIQLVMATQEVDPKSQSSGKPVPKVEPKDNWWDDSYEVTTAAEVVEERSELSGMSVKFEKTRFDSSKPAVQPRRVKFVDRKLSEVTSISEMLLK